MFCKYCGNRLEDGDRFCGACGHLVETGRESAPHQKEKAGT